MPCILSFQIVFAAFNYAYFADNPQAVILSSIGSLPGGLIIGAISAYMRYREKDKLKKAMPTKEKIAIHPHEQIGNIVIISAVAGLLGAKLFHNLENISHLCSAGRHIFRRLHGFVPAHLF